MTRDTVATMPPPRPSPLTRPVSFRFSRDVWDALHAIKARDGVPVSEQVRRALDAWIQLKAPAVTGVNGTRTGPTAGKIHASGKRGILSIRYYDRHGRQREESARTTDWATAARLLAVREAEATRGK